MMIDQIAQTILIDLTVAMIYNVASITGNLFKLQIWKLNKFILTKCSR